MLPFAANPSVLQTAKCFFTHGTVGHFDPAQLPALLPGSGPAASDRPRSARARKPWSAVQRLQFVSQVDVVVPRESADAVRRQLRVRPEDGQDGQDRQDGAQHSSGTAAYARVSMSLGHVLDGAFFREHVKTGNVLMLSRGRLGQDNVFALCAGHLSLYMDRETYERAGLVGKTHGAKGGRGLRPRWVVELDLLSQAMVPGKKGFERLRHACNTVFDKPVDWLFCNLSDASHPPPHQALAAFAPTVCLASPAITDHISVSLPPLGRPASLLVDDDGGSADEDAGLLAREAREEAVVELYEWLSLVRLGSRRVAAGDAIDPYLSRYTVPRADEFTGGDGDASASPPPTTGDVCTIRWRGFLSPSWACQRLLDVLLALQSSPQAWFSVTVSGFSQSKELASDGPECTFFRPANAPGEYMLWEVHGHE